MKKIFVATVLLLSAGIAIGQARKLPEIDPQIIGRWDYVKSVDENGLEERKIIGREHYYADGTVMFVDMMVKPYTFYNFPKSHEELVAARYEYFSGLGTFETDIAHHVLRIKLISTGDPGQLGVVFDLNYVIDQDVIIFDNQHYFQRVKD